MPNPGELPPQQPTPQTELPPSQQEREAQQSERLAQLSTIRKSLYEQLFHQELKSFLPEIAESVRTVAKKERLPLTPLEEKGLLTLLFTEVKNTESGERPKIHHGTYLVAGREGAEKKRKALLQSYFIQIRAQKKFEAAENALAQYNKIVSKDPEFEILKIYEAWLKTMRTLHQITLYHKTTQQEVSDYIDDRKKGGLSDVERVLAHDNKHFAQVTHLMGQAQILMDRMVKLTIPKIE